MLKGVQTIDKKPLLTIEDIQQYICGLETENQKVWQRYKEEHKQICKATEYINNNIDENGYLFLLPSEISVLFSIIKGEE